PTQSSTKHLRRAKQPGMSGNENNEGGARFIEMRKLCGLPPGSGLLRSGE
ncbi:hypothetical protein GWI33_022365, partial [Rhynchophorus ferrugineus]